MLTEHWANYCNYEAICLLYHRILDVEGVARVYYGRSVEDGCVVN